MAVQHTLARDWQAGIKDLLDEMLLKCKTQEYALYSLLQLLTSKEAYDLQ